MDDNKPNNKVKKTGLKPIINPNITSSRYKKSVLDPKTLLLGIRNGDRSALSQAITMLESKNSERNKLGMNIVDACLPFSHHAYKIGITGSPGVGKSTFIDRIGLKLIQQNHKVAVLAVDPTSPISGGSILGDKTRMEQLSIHPKAFVRPSPSSLLLGGTAPRTREAIILCAAAGYDIILVETVGVGQSESIVHSMVDFFTLLILPNSGDHLQGIKRGIVEMADLIAINKAEDNFIDEAKMSQSHYQSALHLFPPKDSQWDTAVILTSSIRQTGLDHVIANWKKYKSKTQKNGYWNVNRQNQLFKWFDESLNRQLLTFFTKQNDKNELIINNIKNQILQGNISPPTAAMTILKNMQPS